MGAISLTSPRRGAAGVRPFKTSSSWSELGTSDHLWETKLAALAKIAHGAIFFLSFGARSFKSQYGILSVLHLCPHGARIHSINCCFVLVTCIDDVVSIEA